MQDMEVFVDGESFTVSIPNTKATTRSVWKKKAAKEVVTEGACTAPIPGMIVEFKKKNGDEVKAGEIVVVLEAMKMMNNFEANKDGVISGIKFESGDSVTKGDVLFSID
jgi:biotin carboxyl carrier protein